MKSKILYTCLILLTLTTISCKKESTSPAIVGKWKNTAVYSDPATGGFGWETVTRFNEIVTFNPNAEFSFYTDVPGGAGIYSFDNSSGDLLLQFEADSYGNSSRNELRRVETVNSDKLVISATSNGVLFKAEYVRIN